MNTGPDDFNQHDDRLHDQHHADDGFDFDQDLFDIQLGEALSGKGDANTPDFSTRVMSRVGKARMLSRSQRLMVHASRWGIAAAALGVAALVWANLNHAAPQAESTTQVLPAVTLPSPLENSWPAQIEAFEKTLASSDMTDQDQSEAAGTSPLTAAELLDTLAQIEQPATQAQAIAQDSNAAVSNTIAGSSSTSNHFVNAQSPWGGQRTLASAQPHTGTRTAVTAGVAPVAATAAHHHNNAPFANTVLLDSLFMLTPAMPTNRPTSAHAGWLDASLERKRGHVTSLWPVGRLSQATATIENAADNASTAAEKPEPAVVSADEPQETPDE